MGERVCSSLKHIGKDTGNKQMFEDALRISRKCEKGRNKITDLESLKKHLRKVHDAISLAFEKLQIRPYLLTFSIQ